jgi:hypothetical protein
MKPLNATQQILQHFGAPYESAKNEVAKPGKEKRRKANKAAARSRRINQGK